MPELVQVHLPQRLITDLRVVQVPILTNVDKASQVSGAHVGIAQHTARRECLLRVRFMWQMSNELLENEMMQRVLRIAHALHASRRTH